MKPPSQAHQSAGRPLPHRPKGCGRGKSGLHRHTVPDNVRRGRPQGQCHRERTARLRPFGGFGAVRVKRCGKSAPRVRQRKRHGKPHREQDRIGTARRDVRCKAITPRGDVRLAVRVGCSRQCANIVPEEWPSRIAWRKLGGALQNPAYRLADIFAKAFSKKTRLTENEGFGVTRRTPRQFCNKLSFRGVRGTNYDVLRTSENLEIPGSHLRCAPE